MRLARDNVVTQLAAGELIRTAHGRSTCSHDAREAVAKLARLRQQPARRPRARTALSRRTQPEDEQAAWSGRLARGQQRAW